MKPVRGRCLTKQKGKFCRGTIKWRVVFAFVNIHAQVELFVKD